jgi:hypothetical protein
MFGRLLAHPLSEIVLKAVIAVMFETYSRGISTEGVVARDERMRRMRKGRKSKFQLRAKELWKVPDAVSIGQRVNGATVDLQPVEPVTLVPESLDDMCPREIYANHCCPR